MKYYYEKRNLGYYWGKSCRVLAVFLFGLAIGLVWASNCNL